MNNIEELRDKRKKISDNVDITLRNIQTISDESYRVAEVAHNAKITLEELDNEFERITGLDKTDWTFLRLATALQVARWALLPGLGESFDKSDRLDHNDKSIIDMEKEKRTEFKDKNFDKHAPERSGQGYKSWAEIVFSPVPYDSSKGSPLFGVNMEGQYHRYKTLGHDPVLGWIFGTMNIITDTITLNNMRTFNVDRKTHIWTDETNIINGFYGSYNAIKEDTFRLPAAIFAQGLHLKSDEYTKCGLPIPVLGTFSEELAGKLYKSQYDSLCLLKDIKTIGKQAFYSILINMIVSLVHGLFYDENKYNSRDLYEVKTRKILMYSNLIASASNIIYVAVNAYLGNESAAKKLDIGGIIVTIYRLINDTNFIMKVKEEFVFGQFKEMIKGKNLILEEID